MYNEKKSQYEELHKRLYELLPEFEKTEENQTKYNSLIETIDSYVEGLEGCLKNTENYKVYFYNYEKEKTKLENIIEERRKLRRKNKWLYDFWEKSINYEVTAINKEHKENFKKMVLK